MIPPQPASSRGGSDATRALVNRARMKKAPQISAVQEMATGEPAAAPEVPTAAPRSAPPATVEVPAAAEVTPEVAPPAAAPEVTPEVERKVEPAPAPQPSPAPKPVKKSEKEGYKKTGNGWQTIEQWNRTRSTYGATRHLTGHLSLADYVVAALEFYDQHIEEKFNNGEPFDFNPMNIPQGRPVGSTNQPKG